MARRRGRFFSPREYQGRLERTREAMAKRGLDALLVSSPENVYYLCGLDHMGYFAFQALVVPREGRPLLVTRAMEKAIVRDQVPDVVHVGYSDGVPPIPAPSSEDADLVYASPEGHGDPSGPQGLEPWSMSVGVSVRSAGRPKGAAVPVEATCKALDDAGLAGGRLGMEMANSFLPHAIARGLIEGTPEAEWEDASGLVDDLRIVQSPRELECTREAAAISDSMMLSAIAAAGPGVEKQDVMAALYQTMFQRGGTYPGFIPLVRSTQTLSHEHGTWDASRLSAKDVLFLEMAGCVRRYHAPIGRLVFIGKAPARAGKILELCRQALEAAERRIGPGVPAGEVYRAWHACLEEAGLSHYHRHHCGYSVGIGYPPSWSGSGVPVGLRQSSDLALEPGMVFHLMSWLLRTGKGDSFLSDTAVVTEDGCEVLTKVSRELYVR
jgi:Xaa-Pro dipeptidase